MAQDEEEHEMMWLVEDEDQHAATSVSAVASAKKPEQLVQEMEAELNKYKKELTDVRKELAAKVSEHCRQEFRSLQHPDLLAPLQTVQLLRKEQEAEKRTQQSQAVDMAAVHEKANELVQQKALEMERQMQTLLGQVQQLEITLYQKEEVRDCHSYCIHMHGMYACMHIAEAACKS